MQLNLQRKILYSLILVGLLFIGGHLIAQEPNPANIQEDHDTKDLEKLLKRYNTDQEKVLEDTSKIHTIEAVETKSEMDEVEVENETRSKKALSEASEEMMKSTLEKRSARPKMISTELSNSVRLALEPLQKLSEKDLLKRLDESTKDSKLRPYMNEFPNSTLYAVRLIKDKESIPSMVKILEDKDRLIYFSATMLCTILFGMILKRVMHREGRKFLKAAAYFLIRVTAMFMLRIYVIYYFYNVELTPAARVFKATFL